MRDIGGWFNRFSAYFADIVRSSFSILDSIMFFNISLFDIILSSTLIMAFIPVVFSFAKGGVRSSRSGYRSRVRSSRRRQVGGDD